MRFVTATTMFLILSASIQSIAVVYTCVSPANAKRWVRIYPHGNEMWTGRTTYSVEDSNNYKPDNPCMSVMPYRTEKATNALVEEEKFETSFNIYLTPKDQESIRFALSKAGIGADGVTSRNTDYIEYYPRQMEIALFGGYISKSGEVLKCTISSTSHMSRSGLGCDGYY